MKICLMIVIVEDDESTREMLTAAFREEGHVVHAASTIKDAEAAFSRGCPDLIILDRGLPDGDGIQLGMRLKKDPALRGVPLLMLTGKAETADRVLGLRLGADDYLAKPFALEELLARADALVRRSNGGGFASSQIACSGIVVDVRSRRVLADGNEIKITGREYDLLKALVERAGTALSREFLMETVWRSLAEDKEMKIVDVTVMGLRRKLGAAGGRIIAVRGMGYMLQKPIK